LLLTFAYALAGCGGSSASSGNGGSSGLTGGSSGAAGAGGATASGGGGATGAAGAGAAGAGAAGAAGTTGAAGAASFPCAPPANIDQPAATLGQTGCMDAANPTALAAVVVPYEVNSPLWSDGANKARGLRLPPGGKIHVRNCAATPSECAQGAADDGRWVFPVGTVMVKSFLFDGKLLETRLFVHADASKWVGYSYAWNQAQTEATIVPDAGVEVTFDTGQRTIDWHYPSRMDCMTCHVASAGSTLGPSTAQMNRPSGAGTTNQIDALAAMGLFDATVPNKAALVVPYPSQAGTPPASATIDDRVRSYLQANCAFCHRPDDYVFPNFDLRAGVALKDMGICNVSPYKGDQGIGSSAMILAAGHPESSVMVQRMGAAPADAGGNYGRMPKVASYVLDQSAIDLLTTWVSGITSCPM
jgi:hypothetical protein